MEYIIWNPSGTTPPRVRFSDRAAAEREAERLARAHAGAQFYVCALVSVSRVQTVETLKLDGAALLTPANRTPALDRSSRVRARGGEHDR